jgi:ABC-type sugar transport system substrate-binding protein
MIRFGMARSILIVALLDAACMYALNHALEPPIGPRSRLLFVGNTTSEYWQRAAQGAQDAARMLGVDLDVEMPTPDDLVDQQISVVRRLNSANYDGIAMSPAAPESQVESINDLAGETNVVTIDRDADKSKRMCHVGYCQVNAGRLVARLVREQLSRPGKVVLLTTVFSDEARNTNVCDRLDGFEEQWGPSGQDDAMRYSIVKIAADSNLAATLVDPELAFIVACDCKAAEAALKALASQSETRRIPMIAFEPNQAIFDAIDDGRVCSAIFDDPYLSGFTAIERLGRYRSTDKTTLPIPGQGSFFLCSEVVRKENIADIRRRIRS